MFFVFDRKSGDLAGGCQLSNVRQGIAQSAVTMGYWMGKKFAGQGLMTDAVATLVRHAFDRMGFHRVEAACLASNTASRRVLAKVGFTAEGTARKYLKINGEWQDHLLFAIIAGDPVPGSKQ
jgi:ribosomal-protein-alanine N-acetyltransferase